MKETKDTARRVLAALREAGADEASCSVTETETREFNVDGGKGSLFRGLFDTPLRMTVFKDRRRGTVGLNKTDDESIRQAVEDCMAAAAAAEPDEAWGLAETGDERTFLEGAPEPELDRFFDRTSELMDDIKARYPKILVEQMITEHKSYRQTYVNTSGAEYTTVGGEYGVSVMFSGHDGDKSSSFNSAGAVFASLDKKLIDLGSIDADLAATEKQIDTLPMEGKFVGTVVLTPGCLGECMDSLLGSFTGDSAILDGSSIWKDKLGEKVADERITVRFDPFDERIVCGERFTGEGYLSEPCDVIKDGVLERFMLSRFVSKKTGFDRLPNGGSAMVIPAGDKTLDELIAGVERGILVGRFSGGAPSNAGDFSGVAKNSFLIENGKISSALSETMISGNLAELLRSLVGFSKETVADGASVLPWGVFTGVTISGK
ncbi:MAG: TldD/PmbA family protein [Clostridia bacterium]|nr:TldD/PmbA family protein [Clostridia bacterium]